MPPKGVTPSDFREDVWYSLNYNVWPLNTISGFAFVDVAALRRSKSMSKPNFVDISQLMTKIG